MVATVTPIPDHFFAAKMLRSGDRPFAIPMDPAIAQRDCMNHLQGGNQTLCNFAADGYSAAVMGLCGATPDVECKPVIARNDVVKKSMLAWASDITNLQPMINTHYPTLATMPDGVTTIPPDMITKLLPTYLHDLQLPPSTEVIITDPTIIPTIVTDPTVLSAFTDAYQKHRQVLIEDAEAEATIADITSSTDFLAETIRYVAIGKEYIPFGVIANRNPTTTRFRVNQIIKFRPFTIPQLVKSCDNLCSADATRVPVVCGTDRRCHYRAPTPLASDAIFESDDEQRYFGIMQTLIQRGKVYCPPTVAADATTFQLTACTPTGDITDEDFAVDASIPIDPILPISVTTKPMIPRSHPRRRGLR